MCESALNFLLLNSNLINCLWGLLKFTFLGLEATVLWQITFYFVIDSDKPFFDELCFNSGHVFFYLNRYMGVRAAACGEIIVDIYEGNQNDEIVLILVLYNNIR